MKQPTNLPTTITALKSYSCILLSSLSMAGCQLDSKEPTVYDETREYWLPYQAGKKRFLAQGYFGSFSHSGYALDFVMPVGTPVLAARSGIVSSVVDSHSGNCPSTLDCSNNDVRIDHLDGTWGVYLHIKQYGACVTYGQQVERGDVIAYSGNVGFSTAPHLHFEVYGAQEPPTFVDINQKGTGYPNPFNLYMSANEINVNYCEDSTD